MAEELVGVDDCGGCQFPVHLLQPSGVRAIGGSRGKCGRDGGYSKVTTPHIQKNPGFDLVRVPRTGLSRSGRSPTGIFEFRSYATRRNMRGVAAIVDRQPLHTG